MIVLSLILKSAYREEGLYCGYLVMKGFLAKISLRNKPCMSVCVMNQVKYFSMKTATEILKSKFVSPEKCDWYQPMLECMEEYARYSKNDVHEMVTYNKGERATTLIGFTALPISVEELRAVLWDFASESHPTVDNYLIRKGYKK